MATRGAGIWCLALACLMLAGTVARGQESAEKAKDSGPTIVGSLGWGGQVLVPDRWGPLAVYITAGDRAVAGTVSVRFRQDSTQWASIAVPFAATPNRTTRVPIVACLPQYCDRVEISLSDERGRLLGRMEYARNPSDQAISMPPELEVGRGLMVCVGRCSLSDSVRAWTKRQDEAPGYQGPARVRRGAKPDLSWAWRYASSATIVPEDLPESWVAYDGVTALVVNPASVGPSGQSADPRAIEAVHQWVRAGGRLAIMADSAGESWRAWLPDEVRGEVSLEAAAVRELPGVVGDLVRQAANQVRQDVLPGEETAERGPEEPLPGPVEAAPQRAVQLSARAAGLGWSLRWPVGEDRGLMAEGPVGFGHVVVLGLDPGRTAQAVSGLATSPVWRDAMGRAVEDWLWLASGAGREEQTWYLSPRSRAEQAAVERVGDVPMIGDGVFVLIALSVLVLVLMVGPVDYFVLKRLRIGHRSWLTAILWIGLACMVAFAAPRVVRTDPTQVNRLNVVDRLVVPGAAVTARTGITGVYAAQSGVARPSEPDLTSWWRGVSLDHGVGEFSAMAVVPTSQAAAGGEAGSMRGNPMVAVPLSLWTFRSFMDQTLQAGEWSRLTAMVRPVEGGYRVAVMGMPEGAAVAEAALRVGESWYSVRERVKPPAPPRDAGAVPLYDEPQRPPPETNPTLGAVENGAWSGVFRESFSGKDPEPAWANLPPSNQDYMYSRFETLSAQSREPGLMLDLSGPDRRTQGVTRMVQSGRFAAVYLSLHECPPTMKIDWPSTVKTSAVVRLIVPLEGAP
jgi:hypothetical protein